MEAGAWFTFSALILSAALPATSSGPGNPTPLRTRAFEFEYVARVPALPERARRLRLWIPVPQSNAQQQISALRIESPIPYQLHHDPEYGDRYAYLELSPARKKGPFEVRVKFHALRREHQVDLADPPNPSREMAPPPNLARWLQPDRLVPIDGIIGQLSKEQTKGLSSPLEKARAIYNFVVSTMKYDKSGQGWGRGDAIYACSVRKGNCTDFHSLLTGMMRAAGIPAKFEIGFALPPDQRQGELAGYHCWAEFYLEGLGWVPVDASEAWQNPARRNYYFGGHDEDRIKFTEGRDIRFNPPQQGEAVNYFVYPYAELDGKPFAAIEHKFFFHDLPRRKP